MVKLEILMACVFYKEPHHEFIAQRSEPKITGRGHRPSVMDAGVSLTRAIRVVREAFGCFVWKTGHASMDGAGGRERFEMRVMVG